MYVIQRFLFLAAIWHAPLSHQTGHSFTCFDTFFRLSIKWKKKEEKEREADSIHICPHVSLYYIEKTPTEI